MFVSDCDRQTDMPGEWGGGEMGQGVSINTVSAQAQGLSDPAVNFEGGCGGHPRGQRSALMLITNNALLCPQHQRREASRRSLRV